MSKKSIFISYDYDNDRNYKNMLLAWDKNTDFDFKFDDKSADVSINSSCYDVIKRAISAKINSATYFLCLVGEKTYKSDWVRWEIQKAIELKKKIIVVKIDSKYITQVSLYETNANWAMNFSFLEISNAINGKLR